MIQFRRRQVGQPLIKEVLTGAKSGRSSVLLGPRYGGKRHVLQTVRDCLIKHTGSIVIYQSSFEPGQASDVWIDGAGQQRSGGVLALADELFERFQKPIHLLLSTIDSLPHHEARKLLSGIRTREEARKLVAVLAGECNLRELVHGSRSEFNCAIQYILQGYDLDEFKTYLEDYNQALKIRWTSLDEAAETLHRITGGSTYLLRMMVSLVLDWRADKTLDPDDPIDPQALLEHRFRLRALPEAYWAHVFRHTAQAIATDPECWLQLEQLLRDGRVPLGLVNEPLTLEVAGLAVLKHGDLIIESKLIQEFAKDYYTGRRYADLYAQEGRWPEGFSRYASLPEAQRIRPAGPDDTHDMELLVGSLNSAMHAAAAVGQEEVERLFSDGCRLLLGFPEVSYWINKNAAWELEGSARLPADTCSQSRELLGLASAQPGWIKRDSVPSHVAGAVILNTYQSSVRRAVVVGDFAKGTVISRQRERLLQLLSTEFFKAHSHAVNAEGNRRRLAVRDAHVRIIANIFSGLGSRLLDQQHVLQLSDRELRKFGYKRVAFTLQDPEQASVVTEIAQLHPAEAVVPIIDHRDQVVGAINIERQDGAAPSETEIQDLTLFGRMLAGLLAQVRRMTMIYEALNRLPEPLLISDRLCQVKFANQPACELYPQMHAGWQETPAVLTGRRSHEINNWFKSALSRDRHVEQVRGIGIDDDYQGEVLAKRIDGFGAVVHIDNHNFLNSIFEAIAVVGKATNRQDLITSLLDATTALGFEKSRFYEKHAVENLLESRACRGHLPENEQAFNSGIIKLSPSDKESWKCIVEESPQVFFLDSEAPAGQKTRRNEWGLEEEIVRGEAYPILEKRDGDSLVDLPLGGKENPFGKLSLARRLSLKPEELELLRVLGKQATRILTAIDQQGKIIGLQKLEDGTRRAFAMVSHQFRNELTPVDSRLTRYRRRAEASPEVDRAIHSLNDDLGKDLKLLHSIIDRMPEFLGTVTLRHSDFDLLKELHMRVSSHENISSEVICASREVLVRADRIHLGAVVNELLENTRTMWRFPDERPHVTITVTERRTNEGDIIRLEYLDNGPGIPEEIRESSIFQQGYSYRPGQSPGTGIGLNYAKRVLVAHGGDIRAEKLSRGALFALEFPKFGAEGVI